MSAMRITCSAIISCLVFVATAIGAELQPFSEAVPIEGAPFRARLQSLNAERMATWTLPSGETRKLPLADVCWWGNWAETPTQPQLVLVDGSVVVADATGLDKERLAADWSLGGELKLPLEWIGGILFAPPVDRQQADLLRFLLRDDGIPNAFAHAKPVAQDTKAANAPDGDRLILLNGDELGGNLMALDENAVKFRATAGEVSVGREKIAALPFNPSLAAKLTSKEGLVWIGFQDGSRLLATALTIDRGRAKIKLPAGIEIGIAATKIDAIQPLGGRTTYLSDLKPAGYQHIPFLDLAWPYRTDRNVVGSQLRAGGRLYLKGLGMHTAARLTYDLAKPCRQFAAEAAIDDQTVGRGSALFRVYTDDGSGKWQLKYESPIVRGGAAPATISVDLTGAKRLSLLVDFADHGDEQAHADWLNARLLP
jgi:NPCBM/NEW2 domain